jgi:protein phosphatase PTC2/3
LLPLHGRAKDEWYTWITDRVRENDGCNTPRSLPQLYPVQKLKLFKEQRKRKEERDRRRATQGSGAEGSPDDEGTNHFLVMEDDTGGLALMGGPPGLRGDMVRSALVQLLARN